MMAACDLACQTSGTKLRLEVCVIISRAGSIWQHRDFFDLWRAECRLSGFSRLRGGI